MANDTNSLSGFFKELKSKLPKDLKNASADELMGVLSSLKEMANDASEEMNKNASQDVKDKYSDGFNALDNMIEKGMENPESEIETDGLDKYISVAKASRKVRKLEKKIDKD